MITQSSPDQPHKNAAPPRERIVNVAPLTLGIVILIVAVHLLRVFILSPEQDQALVIDLGFIPATLRAFGFSSLWPWFNLVSYALLHFGWMHLIVNATGVLAFGHAVEKLFGKRILLSVLFTGIIAGVLVHFLFYSTSTVVLGGISAGLSALFAVVLAMLRKGGWRAAFPSLVGWLAINLVIGLLGVPGQPGLATAWVAHMGGFFAGLAFLPFLFPAYRICTKDKTHDPLA